jgi:hypothetical protein
MACNIVPVSADPYYLKSLRPMFTFFPDEHVITKSDDRSVMLTSHRISYEAKDWGRMYNQSIMLEHVSSSEYHYETRYWLLVIAVLFGAIGVFSVIAESVEIVSVCFMCALVLCVLFILTRQSLIVIGSPSTKMRINVNKMSPDAALRFIDQVETAKYRLTVRSGAVTE